MCCFKDDIIFVKRDHNFRNLSFSLLCQHGVPVFFVLFSLRNSELNLIVRALSLKLMELILAHWNVSMTLITNGVFFFGDWSPGAKNGPLAEAWGTICPPQKNCENFWGHKKLKWSPRSQNGSLTWVHGTILALWAFWKRKHCLDVVFSVWKTCGWNSETRFKSSSKFKNAFFSTCGSVEKNLLFGRAAIDVYAKWDARRYWWCCHVQRGWKAIC